MSSLYLRDVLRKGMLIIALCPLLGGLGAWLGSRFFPESYQATAIVDVNIPEINAAAFYDSDKLIQTRMQLATSQPVLTQVAQNFPGMTVDKLTHEITTASNLNALTFQITVRDSDPVRAAALTNALANAVITYQAQLDQQDNQNTLNPLQTQLANLRAKIAQEKAQVSALTPPQDNAKIATLQAQINADQQLYTQVLATYAQTEQAQANKALTMHIVQAAQPNSAPENINYVLYVGIGLLVGLLLGIFIVLARDQLDQRLWSPQQVSDHVAWPIITDVSDDLAPGNLTQTSEAMQRGLRGIAFLGIDQVIRSIAVVDAQGAANAGELGAQLALESARSGKKTLLIDANFRRPSQADRYHLAGKQGLSDALLAVEKGDALHRLADYIQPTPQTPNLSVMAAGSAAPNPAQLLQSKAMAGLTAALANLDYAFIVMTGPALRFGPETRALAACADGIVPVVDLRQVGRLDLQRWEARLRETGTPVLGCIVKGGRNRERVATKNR